MIKSLVILSVTLAMLCLTTSSAVNAATLTPQDNQAKQDIISNMSDAVDHKYSRYDLIIGSVVGDNSSFVIYNKSAETGPPPPICGTGTHEEDGKCMPDLPQCEDGQFYNTTSQQCEDVQTPPDNTTQPPTSNETTTKIDFAGDYSGTSVINAMKARNADYNIALGDLGYKSDLSEFKSNFNKLNNHQCVIGNHDSEEDGSSALAAESKAYCGDIWMFKVANGTTLLIGINTNGNLDTQLGTAQAAVTDEGFMQGVKNVIVMSHKPAETHPNSHHTPEAAVKTFYQSLDAKTTNVNDIHIVGHNHEYAMTADKTSFLAGSGGQTSHRSCGTNSIWNFCKTGNAFLELEITNDGDIDAKFYNTSGGVVS